MNYPKNLLLDILNPDLRSHCGLYLSLSRAKHIKYICEILNIAVLFCRDYCLIPPGFIVLSDISLSAIKKKSAFITNGLIRLPIRESNLETFFEKKRREYSAMRKSYPFLYKNSGEKFIQKHAESKIIRKSKVGKSIAEIWERGPDINPIWFIPKNNYPDSYIEIVRKAPAVLIERGIANTQPALWMYLKDKLPINQDVIHSILQNSHGMIYKIEYDLSVLKNLPFFITDYKLGDSNYFYDFLAIKITLKALGLWEFILSLSDFSIIDLRCKPGFYRFIEIYKYATNSIRDYYSLGKIFSIATTRLNQEIKAISKIHEFKKPILFKFDEFVKLSMFETEIISEFLEAVSINAKELLLNRAELDIPPFSYSFKSDPKPNLKHIIIGDLSMRKIAVFVALKTEAEVLKYRWNLMSDNNSLSWSGTLNNTIITVYSPMDMGRVPAAITTMKYLHWCKGKNALPDRIVVTGIAGGFKRNGVEKGDVIIATDIIDLSSRKIQGVTETETEFRPKSWVLDNSIKSHILYTDFDPIAWAASVVKQEEWDVEESRFPGIKIGPMTSLDEVISNSEWVNILCANQPKLLGVEMEAGGVCPAALEFSIKTTVIRGVSDHADPLKTDDIWRRRAMKTIANLIESINLGAIKWQ